jgi:RNA polymerase sigma-70 factor (ECF subfamily)
MMLETFKKEVLPLKNKLFRFANSILGDHDLSMDVVQETMLKVWEKRNDFMEIRNPEAWCMTLTRNFALDKIRSKYYKTLELKAQHDQEYDEQSPYQKTESEDTMKLIERIVEALPQKQRETFHMRDVEGYSYHEISEISGYSIPDVKVNIFRARKEIRAKLIKLKTHELDKSRSAS